MKNQFSVEMLVFSVFSSRFYVEKRVLSSKKDKKSSRKSKITFEICVYWYPEGALSTHLYPYARESHWDKGADTGHRNWNDRIDRAIQL